MTTQATFDVRRGDRRGRTELGWLHAQHAFSFGNYRDPDNMGFRSLRVLNDDVIEPGRGFGAHGHADMEIITWVLDGGIAHRDSTGNSGVIRPGDVQAMTAGRGIRHSEVNASDDDPVHLLQIWIEPAETGLEPSYDQRSFPKDDRQGRWQPVASGSGRDDALRINQDAELSIAELATAREIDVRLGQSRHGYLHVAFGHVRVGDTDLGAGDSITFHGEQHLTVGAIETSQLLFFDLA